MESFGIWKSNSGSYSRCRLAETRMILRLLRKLLTAESIGLILVFSALGTMTYGISASLSGVDFAGLFRVCLASAAISLVLAKTNLNGISASVVVVVLGFIGTWILGAGL